MKGVALGLLVGLLGSSRAAEPRLARPAITGIAHVRILATSLERARPFYTKILGLAPAEADCPAAAECFAVNARQRVELLPAGPTPPASLLAEVAFATADVEQMRRYLVAHGVTAGAVTSEASGAKRFELTDPEGHAIAFVQRAAATGAPAPPAEQVSRRMLHAGFVVRSAESEDRFYRGLLGFRMYWHGGMRDVDTDWLEIQVPDGDDWIEYMLNVPADADKDELGVMNHFALGVAALEPAVQRLRAHGLKSDAEPEVGRDGKWQFDVFDPDATRVEFMELKPAQAPCCHPYEAAHPVSDGP